MGLEKKFTPEELKVIFSNIGAVQLTYGCSLACKFCGFDALPGAREHIPFKQMRSLLEQFGSEFPKRDQGKNDTFFYYASDPWDYKSEEDGERRDFKDVHNLAKQFTGISSGIRTRKVTDDKWISDLESLKEKESWSAQISTLGLSKERVQELREKNKGRKIGIEEQYKDEKEGIRGIGKDILESNSSLGRGGIGCFDGVLITPRGIYSTVQLPISEQYPQGMVIVPFEGFDLDQLKVGIRIDEVLRYVLPINREMQEYGVGGWVNYENGLSEFEVFTGEKSIYLQVDKNFVIVGIDSKGIETQIEIYYQELEREIELMEKSEYSDEDMDFVCKENVSNMYFLCPPGRKMSNLFSNRGDASNFLRSSRYSHDQRYRSLRERMSASCDAYRKRKARAL